MNYKNSKLLTGLKVADWVDGSKKVGTTEELFELADSNTDIVSIQDATIADIMSNEITLDDITTESTSMIVALIEAVTIEDIDEEILQRIASLNGVSAEPVGDLFRTLIKEDDGEYYPSGFAHKRCATIHEALAQGVHVMDIVVSR